MKHMREQDKEIMKTFDIKVSEIKAVLQDLRQNLGKAKHYQDLMNSGLTRDYHVLINSLRRVDVWSFVHVFVLICTGLIQVYVVRSLFDDKMNMVLSFTCVRAKTLPEKLQSDIISLTLFSAGMCSPLP